MSGVVEHLATLTGSRDRDVLDVTLVGAFKDLLRPRLTAVYRCVGEKGKQRWLTRAHLLPGDVAATSDPLWTPAESLPLLEAHPERLACLRRSEVLTLPPAGGLPARIYLPLDSEHESVGVLEIHTDTLPDEATMRLVSAVLRVYRNFQGLLDYSERDTLTGLLNRKTFDECFLRMSAHLAASGDLHSVASDRRLAGGHTAWLGVVDIDNFKRVNDLHGHLIGDEVLLLMARLLRSSFRYYDQLFRFGGEEFVVLMRCGGVADALGAVQRMRTNIERYVFPKVGHVTVSVGLAALRVSDAPNACFERADKALYHAKQHGRNLVCEFAELVSLGHLTDQVRASDVELF